MVDFVEMLSSANFVAHGPQITTSSILSFLLKKFDSKFMTQRSQMFIVYIRSSAPPIRQQKQADLPLMLHPPEMSRLSPLGDIF